MVIKGPERGRFITDDYDPFSLHWTGLIGQEKMVKGDQQLVRNGTIGQKMVVGWAIVDVGVV